jgi:flagellar capping protein FliD
MTPTEPDPTALTISVEPDTQVARNGIINFINAYNDIKLFAARQTEVNSQGGFVDTAVLANNSTFRSLVNSIDAQMNGVVSGLENGQPNRLSEIGVTFTTLSASADMPQVRNILNLDETKLAAALSSNYDAVRRVFEFDAVSDNSNLQVFSRTNALRANNISININPGTTTFEATYDVGNGPETVSFNVSNIGSPVTGYRLTGPEGSAIEGLVLIYSSTDIATINLGMSQGIADAAYNVVNEPARSDIGIVTEEMRTVEDNDTRFEEEILRIDAQVEIFREQLLSKFQALESALTRINALLQSLDAQANARNNN